VNNSHNSTENHFALDIDLPMGTPVMAAREGVVVANVKHFPDTGRLDRALNDQANYVMILHGDGSFASYIHLKQNSSALVAGQRIATGDLIGLSGNSGYSSGPHLHFDVQGTSAAKSLPSPSVSGTRPVATIARKPVPGCKL
jgi:murein DD-endopeptidase MepM/ murein hydrolase activator NlpD